jgi:membrane fusion protein (multidrug efflux system)
MAMFLRKIKLAMAAAPVAAALAAGAVALAQSGIGKPKVGTGDPQHVGSPSWTYHILVSGKGEPPRKVAVVEMTGDRPIRIDAPGALILFHPKRDGEPDRQTAATRPMEIAGPASRIPNAANSSGENPSRSGKDQDHRKIVLTCPKAMDVDIAERYIGRIHAHRQIGVRALEKGYLNQVAVREGQSVKKGDVLFRFAPILNEAKPAAESTNIIAPFDGILGRLHEQQGSLVKEGDILTTLSDNEVMWVYFNVPEKKYLEDRANLKELRERKVELILANHSKFRHAGQIGAIEAQFDKETGTIAYRADFPNPERLLRHGQSGIIVIHRKVHDAIVIPQQATFERLDKRYVYVVDKDDVVHPREIGVQNETEDIFVINRGPGVGDRIVLEGIRQVRDGEKVGYEFRSPAEVIGKLRTHAE